ncbi:lytic transglycosylase domain-containing protein [Altererythrobacter sp. KTW20L]|uniref:transglycosylase SLT domain-containing protein n=1 Tax=Altererythrobacter sp. KTW20L TaxID=2942210 RepID=UPI0020BF828C|nr:transglycosylase SLT domain-containing protein [Altererythrobacter sp. KTW20L]MCL6251671.1 lytic transglycosylase domain-containing protein [Altererythrobacter sp. KTW20L]
MSDPVTTFQPAIPASRAGQSHAASHAGTQASIARAAQRTGVDFSYLLAQARIESGLDPEAEARTSSATGLFQFIDQTWLSTLDRHGERLGLGHLSQAIDSSSGRARVDDPATRAAILDLRTDPDVASLMAGALAGDNRATLLPVLGREPDASELYLAHFLGPAGASQFLGALGSNPETSAAAILPRAARANRAIFYEPGGAPRSVAGVMDVIRGRVDGAMAQGGVDPGAYPATYAAQFVLPDNWQPSRVMPPAPSRGALPSMAETLRTSFALTETGGREAPGLAHIRNAYARLEAFGL